MARFADRSASTSHEKELEEPGSSCPGKVQPGQAEPTGREGGGGLWHEDWPAA